MARARAHLGSDFVEEAARTVCSIHRSTRDVAGEGDVLVFMPGGREVDECCRDA